MVSRDGPPYAPRQRRWSQISWWYSLALPVSLVLLLITILAGGFGDDPAVTGVVRDAYTGEPVEGARVAAGANQATTDGDGRFSFETPVSGAISISRADYEATQVSVATEMDDVAVEIRPTTLSGTVTDSRTEDPIPGVQVTASGPNAATVTTLTDEDGKYLLIDVPPEAMVSVSYDGYTEVSKPVGQNVVLDFEVRRDIVTGIVTDASGAPVPEAVVQIGEAFTTTGADGAYRLGGVPEGGTIVVRKAGYREVTAGYPEDMTFDATLERFIVKGVYANAQTAGDDASWNALLDMVETTELNAVVLDVKDNFGFVRYDSEVPLAAEVGALEPAYDLDARLKDLEERDIYAIARVVVFEDPVLAAARPDLAIKNSTNGASWATWDGQAWVNAMKEEVWQYNIDIAREVAEAGFDEVQLDYIRFPTDGPLDVADYEAAFTPETRTAAITEFLTRARAAVSPAGAYLAVDVFGIAVWVEGDNGIGQDLDQIAPLVDVINPMIYPSHFAPGTFGFDYPNDHPSDVINIVLEHGAARIGPLSYKFRPWLQDFSLGPGIEYGASEVRAQIVTAEEFGTPGWMLWNAGNVYHADALEAE